MTYVIAEPCIAVLDRACPEGYPVNAISYEPDVPNHWAALTDDNAWFFTDPLPGRDRPIASQGGAPRFNRLGVDTELVNARPAPST